AAGRAEEGYARYFLGDVDGATEAFEEERAIAAELGARSIEADALSALGLVRTQAGDADGARARHEQAIAIRRELGNQDGVSEALGNLAYLEEMTGHVAAARRDATEAVAIAEGLGSWIQAGWAHLYLGIALQDGGDLAGAEAQYGQSATTFAEHGAPAAAAFPRLGVAAVELARGQLDAAEKDLRELLAALRASAPLYAAVPLEHLARAALGRGDSSAAWRLAMEELELRHATRQRLTVPIAELQLAEVALLDGKPFEAARLARAAGDQNAAHHDDDGVTAARAVEARALVAVDP